MKKFVLVLAIAAVASPAFAVSRYNSMSYTCAGVLAIVQQDGQAIFNYPSKRTGMNLYERLVRNASQCGNGQATQRITIPTKDNPRCRVMNCSWGSLRP